MEKIPLRMSPAQPARIGNPSTCHDTSPGASQFEGEVCDKREGCLPRLFRQLHKQRACEVLPNGECHLLYSNPLTEPNHVCYL